MKNQSIHGGSVRWNYGSKIETDLLAGTEKLGA